MSQERKCAFLSRAAELCHKTSQVPVTLVTGQESSFKDRRDLSWMPSVTWKRVHVFFRPALSNPKMTPVTGQESSLQRQRHLSWLSSVPWIGKRVFFRQVYDFVHLASRPISFEKRARIFFCDSLMDRISIWEWTWESSLLFTPLLSNFVWHS